MNFVQRILNQWFAYKMSVCKIEKYFVSMGKSSANCTSVDKALASHHGTTVDVGKTVCEGTTVDIGGAVHGGKTFDEGAPKFGDELGEQHAVHRVVRVSCVQRKIHPVKHVEEYIGMLEEFVREASTCGSQLIVFPEYNFLDLLGMIPGFNLINSQLAKAELKKQEGSMPKPSGENSEGNTQEGFSPMLIFQGMAEPVARGIELIVGRLAQKYGIYIYSGSYIVTKQQGTYNVGSLFGPDGEKIGQQCKVHLTDFESDMRMTRGEELLMYELPIGKVVFPICMDATYFETFRIARNMGADVVILPIANPEEYNLWKALKGIWPRVQEAHVYGLKAALNGWLAGLYYTGKAGIFAPLELTEARDGILALAEHYEGDQLVTADLDYALLHEERENAEYYGDRNPDFERDYECVYERRCG